MIFREEEELKNANHCRQRKVTKLRKLLRPMRKSMPSFCRKNRNVIDFNTVEMWHSTLGFYVEVIYGQIWFPLLWLNSEKSPQGKYRQKVLIRFRVNALSKYSAPIHQRNAQRMVYYQWMGATRVWLKVMCDFDVPKKIHSRNEDNLIIKRNVRRIAEMKNGP